MRSLRCNCICNSFVVAHKKETAEAGGAAQAGDESVSVSQSEKKLTKGHKERQDNGRHAMYARRGRGRWAVRLRLVTHTSRSEVAATKTSSICLVNPWQLFAPSLPCVSAVCECASMCAADCKDVPTLAVKMIIIPFEN